MGEYRLLIGGDVFPSPRNVNLFNEGRGNELFDEKIISLFDHADYSICNLEGVLTDSETPISKVDPIIKAPKKAIDGFDVLGLSCVTLANNHVLDYGKTGFEDTIHVLDDKHIAHFGAGKKNEIEKYKLIPAGNKKVILYTVAETMFNVPTLDVPGAHLYDEYTVCSEIKKLKNECDYLIVIYHGGTEFYWYGSELLRKRFHRMADSGADLVTAQHTHCIGIQENYNGAYLLYGQGDFLFARRDNLFRRYGLLLELVFTQNDVEVKRHLIEHIDNRAVYADSQDFDEFDQRSANYREGALFSDEYTDFSEEKMIMFLEAFRGNNVMDKAAKKFLSRPRYINYLKNRYTKKQLLRIVSGVQFEEYRESVIQGLWSEINRR